MENGKSKIKSILVGVDASRSNVKQKTGTEYYSQEIIKHLVENKEVDFRLYSKTPLGFLKKEQNIDFKVMPFPKLWSQIRLSLELLVNKPDVLFEPAHTIPVIHGQKVVTTLHDVGFRHFPELYTPLERFYHNWSMAFAVRHATKIITISESTKKDLVKFYSADPKKIEIIYHGYDRQKFYPKKAGQKAPDEILKLGEYIYFIGRLEAKKNIVSLVKAFGVLRKNHSELKTKLVLAGRPGYLYEDIKTEIGKLDKNVQKDVIEPGYIPDEIMADYLRFAKVFAFPSKFEGFGMPLVEAMACNVPIVASNTTSIPEITGSATLLHDVEDVDQIAEYLYIALKDENIRKRLIGDGTKRLPMFDWDKAASKTLDVIKSALD
ncbi:MAG: glycosyltransferase family 1 protein [bacterium]